MSFEATLSNGDVFKKIIAAVGDLVGDANFECSPDGIRLQAMDSSHVSLVSLFLDKESFENFECNDAISLGINFASLSKVLKCSKSKDSLTLVASENADHLKLTFHDEENARTLTFELKLMEIDSERLVIPETDYKLAMQMSSKEFKDICTQFKEIGDSLSISGTKEGCRFSLSGDIGSGELSYQTTDEDDDGPIERGNHVRIRAEEAVSQNFALRYLVFFTKATGLSSLVHLYMSPDIPLVVEYKIDDLGHLKYYLAPKIDEDE